MLGMAISIVANRKLYPKLTLIVPKGIKDLKRGCIKFLEVLEVSCFGVSFRISIAIFSLNNLMTNLLAFRVAQVNGLMPAFFHSLTILSVDKV
jgi:hypothetical protein